MLNPHKHGDERKALVLVSTVYSEPLVFRYFLTNSMTTPSSLYRCSVVLLAEMKRGPLQLLFL